MIFSIGYQKLSKAGQLVEALQQHGIRILVDVRSKPYGRNPSFRKPHLERTLNNHGLTYWWAGATLGGFSEVNESAIKDLAFWSHGKIACLMCLEAAPDRCHRKNEIGRRLQEYGVDVEHILT